MGGGAQQPQFYINFYNRNCTHKNTTSLHVVGVFLLVALMVVTGGCFGGLTSLQQVVDLIRKMYGTSDAHRNGVHYSPMTYPEVYQH